MTKPAPDHNESAVGYNSDDVDLGPPSLRGITKVAAEESIPQLAIRRSLFPNCPPYINFSVNGAAKPLPRSIRRLLRWKNTKVTPMVVRSVIRRSGFLIQDECRCWSGTWSNQIKSTAFKHFHDHQKFNHLPGTFHIGRKDNLWRNIQQMHEKYGETKFDIMPTTYILPQDKTIFRTICEKNKMSNQCWIVKPPASYRGDGIMIVHKYKQIPKAVPIVVQKYVKDPYLINGNKFDLRLYVLVTSVNPLRIYLYEEGLVRFASVKYSSKINTLDDKYMHLTNYSINRFNEKYESNSDTQACKGHKWTLSTLWRYLRNERQVDVLSIWNSLVDLVIRTVISTEDPLHKMSMGNVKSKYNVYELFGFDVLLDSSLKPWLLEVNVSPSLHSSSRLDKAVKVQLIKDTLNIAGFNIPVSKNFSNDELINELRELDDTLTMASFDNRLYTLNVTNLERLKHFQFITKTNRADYIDRILNDLTPDDVRTLILYEDEQEPRGLFQKVFPTHETHKYLKYFDKQRYYNLLLDAWETKYHDNREIGRDVLRNLCRNGTHLKIPRKSEKIKLVI